MGVVCAHGSFNEVRAALRKRASSEEAAHGSKATSFTLNIFLNYFLGHQLKTHQPNALMKFVFDIAAEWDVAPDTVTFSTLLNSCLQSNDHASADAVSCFVISTV